MSQENVAPLVALVIGLCLAGPVAAQATAPAAPPAGQQQSPTSPAAAPDDAAQAAFKNADVNQDGMLSRDESAKLPAIANRFADLDKNKDGQLSWDEFRAGYRAAP